MKLTYAQKKYLAIISADIDQKKEIHIVGVAREWYNTPMFRNQVDTIFSDTKRSLVELYLEVQQLSEQEFGEDTVVIMEVGSFFEVYGVDTDELQVGKPKEMAEILNLQLTRRNKNIPENSVENPLLAGFPQPAFDRYLQRLIQEEKYTIVLIRQKGDPPKVERYLDRIFSPGVNFDYTLDHNERFVASILIEKQHELYAVGYAGIDVTTGKTKILQTYSTHEDKTYALDELFSLLQTVRTSEVVLSCIGLDADPQKMMRYLELPEDAHVHLNQQRLSNQYQNELFKRTYEIESLLSPIEYLDLERMPLTSEALGVLIEFVLQHDEAVLERLEKPEILDAQKYLYLGNNPLEQLNITSKDHSDWTVLKCIDETSTSIGGRLLKERLLNPITSVEELEHRYALAEAVEPVVADIDEQLKKMYDLERIVRRISLKRLHPFEMNFLADTLQAVLQVTETVEERVAHNTENHIEKTATAFKELTKQKEAVAHIVQQCTEIFNLDATTKVTQQAIDGSLFAPQFDPEIDKLVKRKEKLDAKLEIIRSKIVEIISDETGKDENEYVVLKQLEKEGHYIHLTKSRYQIAKKQILNSVVSLEKRAYAFADFTIKVQTSNVKMTADVIDHISEQILAIQTKIIARVTKVFIQELEKMHHQWVPVLREVIRSVAGIDVATSTIRSAKKLHLTKPKIIKTQIEENYLELEQVRHPLVESHEERGIYVPNDMVLGTKKYLHDTRRKEPHNQTLFTEMTDQNIQGVLLYGINSSGKSSLMKSVGICVLLAQSGFFVPANKMRFSIFTELFTRIVAHDQLEKGLSSFAVEMMELKNILNRCTAKSLILGDEISHGTETTSAIAIVSAAILQLSGVGAQFVFATHLHQLNELECITELEQVVSVHLSVAYNEESDTIIFNRKLQTGSGSTLYGLEFARSLHMDPAFLRNAMDIRKQLIGESTDIDLVINQQKSTYNKELFLSNCAVCTGPVDDTHHIRAQAEADCNNQIDHFDKDHKYNLIPLCKNCHVQAHTGKLEIHGFQQTSKGMQLQYEQFEYSEKAE